tara:strand:+ start:41880 stop:43163 length:1284 start_codon:yes stop_codon:yes gene_type:complete
VDFMKSTNLKTFIVRIIYSFIILFFSINTLWSQWNYISNIGYQAKMYGNGYGYKVINSMTNQPPGGNSALIMKTLDDWVTSDSVKLIPPQLGCCQILDYHFYDSLNGIAIYINYGEVKAKLLKNGSWSTLSNDVGWHSYVSNYIFLDSSLLVGMTLVGQPNASPYLLKRDYNSSNSTQLFNFDSSQYQILNIDADKDGNIYTLLEDYQNNERFLAVSKDTAQTFNYLFSNSVTPFKSVNFIDSLNGYLSTTSGDIYYSNDGGSSWNYRGTPTQNMNTLSFKNDSTIFIGGNSGRLYISEDYGISWRLDSIPTSANIGNIYLVDSVNVYATDWGGNLYKNSITTGLSNTIPSNEFFSVFPNPSSDYIHLKLNQNFGFEEYRVYSLTGKLVQKGRNQKSIDIKNLKEGTYVFQVIGKNYKTSQKIVVQF